MALIQRVFSGTIVMERSTIMKVSRRQALLVLILALAVSVVSGQTTKQAEKPITGFRADYLGQVEHVQKQIMELEGSIPEKHFTWHPSEDVRSVSEVYQHISFGNYIILKLAGIEPPADANFVMDLKKWDSATTDKAKIADNLRKSFDHLKTSVANLSDADLEKKVTVFGDDMTMRNALLISLSHLHEHLGQSIAYARMNGVVPPWTAAEVAKEKEKKDGK